MTNDQVEMTKECLSTNDYPGLLLAKTTASGRATRRASERSGVLFGCARLDVALFGNHQDDGQFGVSIGRENC